MYQTTNDVIYYLVNALIVWYWLGVISFIIVVVGVWKPQLIDDFFNTCYKTHNCLELNIYYLKKYIHTYY